MGDRAGPPRPNTVVSTAHPEGGPAPDRGVLTIDTERPRSSRSSAAVGELGVYSGIPIPVSLPCDIATLCTEGPDSNTSAISCILVLTAPACWFTELLFFFSRTSEIGLVVKSALDTERWGIQNSRGY